MESDAIHLTTELRWLLFTAILAGSLWIPYIVGVNVTDFPGKSELFVRPPDPSTMKPWVHRALRAHQNLLEQLPPFAIVVLVGAVTRVSTSVTVWCAVLFFWIRVAHAVGHVSGLARAPVRPLLYVSGWVVTLTYAWQVLVHAGASGPALAPMIGPTVTASGPTAATGSGPTSRAGVRPRAR